MEALVEQQMEAQSRQCEKAREVVDEVLRIDEAAAEHRKHDRIGKQLNNRVQSHQVQGEPEALAQMGTGAGPPEVVPRAS